MAAQKKYPDELRQATTSKVIVTKSIFRPGQARCATIAAIATIVTPTDIHGAHLSFSTLSLTTAILADAGLQL
jgi:hypothetical protein